MLLVDGTEQLRPPQPIALRVGVSGNIFPVQRCAPGHSIPGQVQPRLPLNQPHAVLELDPVLADQDSEEDAAGDVMHVEEINLPLAALALCRARKIRTRANHLGRPSLEFLLVFANPELRRDALHFLARAPNDTVPHLVAKVGPARRVADGLVRADLMHELDHGLRLSRWIDN